MAQQRLYGAFWTNEDGTAMWTLGRNGARMRQQARKYRALVLSMPLPGSYAWDAPTFRVSADRVDADYRPIQTPVAIAPMKYYTCPHCEANFAGRSLQPNGTMPVHRWQETPCPGTGQTPQD